MTLLVQEISKTIAKRSIVCGVSLFLERGECVGLLGPNGAGKTTCFSIIAGIISPDFGSIFLNGKDVTRLPIDQRARLGLGYLPQDVSIFRGLSVEENILCVLELRIKDYEERQEKLDYLLDEFSLSHLRKSPAIALSGGERRRVEIARALACSPSYILLDEPLAGIDPIAVGEIRELILQLKDLNVGILITDHNVRETLSMVERAYIMSQGTILAEGSSLEIIEHPEVRRTYLGERFSL